MRNKAKYLQRLRNGIDIFNALRKPFSKELPSVEKDDGYLIKSRFTEGKLRIAKRWNGVRHFENQLAKSSPARSVYLCVVKSKFWFGLVDLRTRTFKFFCVCSINFESFFRTRKIPVTHLRTKKSGIYGLYRRPKYHVFLTFCQGSC